MLIIFYILLFSLIVVPNAAIPSLDSLVKSLENDLDRTTEKDAAILQPNVCTSAVCAQESAEIIGSLNVSVDPCENFYEFVCDKYIHGSELPADKDSESYYSIAFDQVTQQIQGILSEEVQPNELKAFQLAKRFYQLCMDMNTRNENG